MNAGALAGLKVLDLSRVLAGPWCGQLLGDLGADVVKVERPGSGDDTRGWGPPWVQDASGRPSDDAAYFFSANRNKRSIALDIATPQGQDLVRRLAAQADVVLENFKVGGLKQYGLDYDSLSAAHPRLIYCSITGFGQTGPCAPQAGYDFLIQAMGGLMSITGERDGQPGAGPQKAGVAVADVLTGLYATIGVLAALQHRQRTGRGQHIDLALLDVQVACLANQAANALLAGVVPQRMGNAHLSIVPYQDFPTADGDMILAIGNDGQFARFCEEAGRLEWASDPRFATNTDRVRHREVLVPLLRQTTVARTTADWMAALQPRAVPCGPINRIDQVFEEPQVRARGMAVPVHHPRLGPLKLAGNPLKLSDSPVSYRLAPPDLDEHSAEVLHDWLGAPGA